MNQAIKYTAIVTVLVGLLTALFIIFFQTSASYTKDEQFPKYTVKEYDGKIAIFSDDDETPKKTLNIYIDELPKKDRQLLKNGITAENDEQLNRILEDYDG